MYIFYIIIKKIDKQLEEDEIRNWSTNKAYNKGDLVVKSLSAAVLLTCNASLYNIEIGLVDKKEKLPKTLSTYIPNIKTIIVVKIIPTKDHKSLTSIKSLLEAFFNLFYIIQIKDLAK